LQELQVCGEEKGSCVSWEAKHNFNKLNQGYILTAKRK
jgi:hypothetical protein